MLLEQIQLDRFIRNLKQISIESRELLKGVNQNRYAAFATLYSDTFKFIRQLETKDAELDSHIKELPTINQLDSLAASTVSSSIWIFVFAQPYVAILILTITAPITVPLLIVKYIKTEKLKQKIRLIERKASSIAFILENPGYFNKPNKDKMST